MDLIQEIVQYETKNPEEKKQFLSQFQHALENSEFCVRVKEGMELIKSYLHPKVSPSSLAAIKSWMHRFEGDFNKKIDDEIQGVLEKGDSAIEAAQDDISCLKDTFHLDDFFMETSFNLGQEFLKEKEFSRAASIFTVLTFLDPFSPESFLSLARAENGLGRGDAAEKSLGIALFLAPEDPGILYHVGRYYLDKGDKDTAKGFFKIIQDSQESNQAMKEYCHKLVA